MSWLLCIGRLASKTDNVMHFACLVKQASVDLVSDLFGLWAVCYGTQTPDATWRFYQPLWWCDSLGQSDRRAELLLMVEWPNCEVAWEQNCLRQSCSYGSPHFGLSSGSWVHPNWIPCNLWLCFAMHTSFRQMSKAEVSWLLCIGRMVSKTDNVMHFAHLVKQASVDLVSDLFGLWAICYGAQSPDATCCLFTLLPSANEIAER